MLNMFRAPLHPSSGAHDDIVGYRIGRLVLELLLVGSYVQVGWMSFRTEGPETRPDGLCGNQRYRRVLLMMGIMVPETC